MPDPVQRATRARSLRGLLLRPLVRTTVNLYLVQSAVLLVPLLTLPYLTRTLGPANLGLLLFAQAYASLATLIVQYGFELSASRDVAQAADDRRKIGEIVAGVISAKVVLVGVSALVSLVVVIAVPLFRENPAYLAAAWALGVAQGLNPVWYFLGRERMGILTLLDIGSKLVAVGAIFVVVGDADDGIVVLFIQAVTAAAGAGAANIVMCRKTSLARLGLTVAIATLRDSLQLGMYWIVAAASLYAPSLLVGVLSSPVQVGYYGLADKLQKIPTALLWPASQALYPRINRVLSEDARRATHLTRVSSAIFVTIGFAAGLCLAATAGWLVPFLFGSSYDPAIEVFRVLALALPFALVGHVLAYQVLMPMRRDRILNYTTWATTAVRLALAVPLVLTHGAQGMAWAVFVGAVVNAAILVVIVFTSSNTLFPRVSGEAAKARWSR